MLIRKETAVVYETFFSAVGVSEGIPVDLNVAGKNISLPGRIVDVRGLTKLSNKFLFLSFFKVSILLILAQMFRKILENAVSWKIRLTTVTKSMLSALEIPKEWNISHEMFKLYFRGPPTTLY
jgi:hypothetical protein